MPHPSRFLRPLLAALSGIGFFAAPAHAVNINNIYFDEHYGGVLGNYYDVADTMPNVAAIFTDYQQKGHEPWCSGSLIHPRAVLTAAHCISNDESQTMPSFASDVQIRFAPDPVNNTSPHDRRAREIVFHGEYFQDDDRDVALISLDRPVHGLDLVALAPKGYMVDKETLVTIVGYGLAGTGTNPGRPATEDVQRLEGYDDGKRRIAVTRIGALEEDKVIAEFRDPARPDEFNRYGLTSPIPDDQGEPEGGDSGGPLFVETATGWLQIGTVMGGGGGAYGNAGYGSVDSWTFIPFYSDWITANLVSLLDSGVESATAATAGGVRRWSDAATWTAGRVPENTFGMVDGAGQWRTGSYYEVALNNATHVAVDSNVHIDSLHMGHADARLDILTGQQLHTVLETHVLSGQLHVDGTLDSDAVALRGGRLSGNGIVKAVTGVRQTGGVLAPGGSPGTLAIAGDLTQTDGARLEIDIDGPGRETGPGNHDRLLVSEQYTAGGRIAPVLRGIDGAANNDFTPVLGQGFEVVRAGGGIAGGYAGLDQPAAGLPAGTRFDTVYGANAIALYATPAAYGNLGAAGVEDSRNRRELGGALDAMRPEAGVRAQNPDVQRLYDGLAPQSAASLPTALDQLGGVGYAQLIQAGFENSKFLADQTHMVLAAQRRGDALAPMRSSAGPAQAGVSENGRRAWATAIGRLSSQKADNGGYKTTDSVAGLIGGMQMPLASGTVIGYSLGYVHGSPDVKHDMGGGRSDNVQLTGYASRGFGSGYFVQGTLGAGLGRNKVARSVAVTQAGHDASMHTRNLSASGLVGWATGGADEPRFELTAGLRYMAYRYKGFSDGGPQASRLDVDGDTLHSAVASLGAAATLPFTGGGVDWRASGWIDLGHEFGDRHVDMGARLLNASYRQHSGDIGRDRLAAGLSLSGQMSRRTVFSLGVSGEVAKNWKAASATMGVQVAF